jgi:hypothetical protein
MGSSLRSSRIPLPDRPVTPDLADPSDPQASAAAALLHDLVSEARLRAARAEKAAG